MDVPATLQRAADLLSARRVFGDPCTADGVTVIPVAKVGGGGGGGSGGHEGEEGLGGGGGFQAKPAGVYVIREGGVRWQPAVDVNRVALGAQAVTIVALLVLREWIRRRR